MFTSLQSQHTFYLEVLFPFSKTCKTHLALISCQANQTKINEKADHTEHY